MNYFLKNPIAAAMCSLGIIVLGLVSLAKLPVGLMPRVEYPALSVIVEYPGISPEKIEHLITRPIERIIRTVPGIETIESSSEEGKSRIIITLHPDIDVKIAALKVREKIALIRDSFPRAVQEPVVLRHDPSERPALIAAVKKIPVAEATPTAIREYAEHTIKPRLSRIDGVSEIFLAGGLQKEIHVTIDGGKFFSRNLDFSEIVRALQRENVSIPAGSILSGGSEWRLRISERFQKSDDIARVVLRSFDGTKLLFLRDIARVEESSREADSIARHNGEERVLLYLHKAADANTLGVISQARDILSALPDCEIEIIYSQADYIRASLSNAVSSGLWGLLIVVCVIALLYRDVLKACAITLSIPLSLVAVFACMYFARHEINIVSLSGLALAAGMVVDAGILVMEKISGGQSMEKIASAVRRIRLAATASTITTAAVFLPILFADEIIRRTYEGIAFTVTVACVVSLFVATSLLPSLYIWIRGKFVRKPNSLRFPQTIDELFQRAQSWYASALSTVFIYRKKILLATGVFASLSILFFFCIRKEFIDPFGGDEVYLYCELPTGTPLRIADEATKKVEARIKELHVAEKISSKSEKWRGSIALTLKKYFFSERRNEDRKRLAHEAQRVLAPYGGFAYLIEAAESASRELDLIFTGKDDATLRRLAREAAKEIGKVAGIEECVLRFRDGKPSYRIVIDREKSGMFGQSPERLSHFFHGALFGPVALKYHTGEREIDVRVKFDRKIISGIGDVLSGSLPVGEGRFAPLSEMVHIEEGFEPTRLTRHNARRAVRITARLGNISFADAAAHIRETLRALRVPEEYSWEFDTSFEKSHAQFRTMALLLLTALLLVYMTMAAILESLYLPILIIATVPVGICGVFTAFFLFDVTLNASALMGMILLAGIAVNNGIVIAADVAFAVRRAGRGIAPDEIDALGEKAAREHFRPLFATTLTTIAGFLPALFSFGEGSALWRPLALSVISGLACSSLAAGFILPTTLRYFISHSRRSV